MNQLQRIFVVIAVIFVQFWAFTQDFVYDIQQFDKSNGLLNREVNTIFEDQQGFIWIGMKDGIQRYDGHNFKTWSKYNSKPDLHDISAFGIDDEGWLWMYSSMYNNFLFLNTRTEELLTLKEKFNGSIPKELRNLSKHFNHHTRILFSDSKDQLVFVFSNPNRIVTYANQKFTTVLMDETDGINIQLHFVDSQNNLWVKTEDAPETLKKINAKGELISTFDIKSFIQYDFYEVGNEVMFTSLGQEKKYLIRINKLNDEITFDEIENNSTRYVQKDLTWDLQNGNWNISSKHSENAVLTFDNKLFQPSLFDFINLLYKDSQDRIWVCSAWGLSRVIIKPSKFARYIHLKPDDENTTHTSIRGIYANKDNLFGVVNFEGVTKSSKSHPEKWTFIDHVSDYSKKSYPYYAGCAIQKINEELLMVGVDFEIRIIKKSGEVVRQIDLKNHLKELTKKHVTLNLWSTYQAKDKSIWIGTSFGIWKLAPDYSIQKVTIGNENGNENNIYHIIPGSDKQTLWLSSDKGLFLFDTKTMRVIEKYGRTQKNKHFLPANTFYFLHIDAQNIHWLGTNEGLIRWDKKSGKHTVISSNDGLSNNTIYSIFGDNYNNLWLATDYGINRYNIENKNVTIFHENDGITNEEFNRSSAFQEADGTIYFGGINGITRFHPKDFKDKQADKLYLQITNFELFNDENNTIEDKTFDLKQHNRIRISTENAYFKLSFALPNLDNQKNANYAWRIVELDKTWKHQKENVLTLAALPYGEYTLQLKGQSENGKWSKITNINLVVEAPFYLKAWFFLLIFVIFLAGVILFFRRRNYRLRKQQKSLKIEIHNATKKILADKKIIEIQAQELLKLDETKSRFFANVTHELRTPISLVLGPISKILKSPELNADSRKYLTVAQQNSKELLRLVNSLLDLSKMESGKMEVNEEPIAMFNFTRLIASNFESYADQNGVKFYFTYNADQNLQILSDKEKIETILKNLISNAIKYTPANGAITIHVEDKEKVIAFSVSDTGKGIHPEDIPHIFERFYQTNQTNTPAMGGTGIGLALSREFAQLLKASLTVQSELGKGSCFTLEIPRKEVFGVPQTYSNEDISTIEKQETADFNPTNKTVLIVEDNHSLRDFLQSILVEQYNVLTAKNGLEALKKLESNSALLPDLIVSDIMMPEMDGYQLLKILKTTELYASIPVIMLTARVALEDKLKALRIGVDDYLHKPFEEEELLVRIANLLQNAKERQQVIIESDEAEISNSVADQEWLEKLENYIQKNIEDSSLSIPILASEFAMSESSFLRHIKKLTGLTPGKYLQEIRLNHSRILLETGAVTSISEVATIAGFKDPKAFSRSFKKRFGRSPSSIFS